MKLDNEFTGTALRSGIVAPVLGGALAGVCPQAAFRRVHRHAVKNSQGTFGATLPTTGDAGMVTGHRSWSPPIT